MAKKKTKEKQSNSINSYLGKRLVRVLIYLLFFLTPLVIFGGVFYDVSVFPKYLVSQALIILAAICMIFSLMTGRIRLRSWFAALHPVFILFGFLLISTLFSKEPGLSIRSLPAMVFFLIFSLICGTYIRTPREIRNIFSMILASAFINTIYGILQYHGIDFLKWYGTADIGRVAGFLGNATWYGSMLVSAVIVCLAFTLGILKGKYTRAVGIAGLFIVCFAILLSGTRSSFVSITITTLGMLLVLFWRYRGTAEKIRISKKQILVAVSIVIVIALLVGGLSGISYFKSSYGKLISRIVDIYSPQSLSVRLRLLIWYTTVSMIKDNPVFGVGWGCFPSQFNEYKIPVINNPDNSGFLEIVNAEPDTELLNVHNEYLHFCVEAGILFFIAFVYVFITALLLSWKYIKDKWSGPDIKESSAYYVITGFCVFAFLIDGMFAFPLHLPANGLYFWGFIGILLGSRMKENGEEETAWPAWPGITAGVLLIAALAVFSYVNLENMRAANAFYKGRIQHNASLGTTDPNLKATLFFKAIEYYDQGNKINSYNGNIVKSRGKIHMTLGEAYQKAGRIEESRAADKKAIADFRRALDLTNDKQIYLDLSALYGRNGAFRNAEQYAQKAVLIDPQYPMAQYNLAKVAVINRDYETARKAFTKALQANPDNQEYYYYMAVLLEDNLGDDEMAMRHFQTYLSLPGNPPDLVRSVEKRIKGIKVRQLVRSGKEAWAEGGLANCRIAKRYFEKALALDPMHVDTYYDLGVLKEEGYKNLYHILTADQYYRKFLELADPEDPRINEVNKRMEGISELREYNNSFRDANNLVLKGEYEEGIRIFESLLVPEPKYINIYYRLGQVYSRYTNDDEKALFYFQEYLDRASPDDTLKNNIEREMKKIEDKHKNE